MPDIFIVLATYNGERFLKPFLDSVCKQTRKITSIIAVDDGSRDSTRSILQSYSQKLPLSIHRQEQNRGYLATFSPGLEIAKKIAMPQDFIAFADPDDIWLSQKLEFLEKSIGDADLVFGDATVIDAKGNKLAGLPQDKFAIVVADNGSSDGTSQKIKENFPAVFITEMNGNKGFGTANNRAIRFLNSQIDFDSICLLNNDTIPEKETIVTLQKDLQIWNTNHSEYQVVFSPQMQHENGTAQVVYYTDFSLQMFFTNAFCTTENADIRFHGTPIPISDRPYLRSAYYTGAVCWMMNYSHWESCKGFDEKIFMYYEDTGFAWRANALGTRFFLDTRLSPLHLGGGSTETSLKQALQHDHSQEYVFKKRKGKRGFLISKQFKRSRSGIQILIFLPLIPVSARTRKNLRIHLHLFKDVLCHF